MDESKSSAIKGGGCGGGGGGGGTRLMGEQMYEIIYTEWWTSFMPYARIAVIRNVVWVNVGTSK